MLLNTFVFSLFILFAACTTMTSHEGSHELRKGIFYVPKTEKPFTGIYHRYQFTAIDEKKPQQDTIYKDGLKNGIQITWYANGGKRSEISYLKGKRGGQSMTWYPSGSIQRLEVVERGRLTERSGWYENGETKTSYDAKNNTTTHWYLTGEKQSEWKTNKEGVFTQQNTVWHRNGLKAYFVNYDASGKQGLAIQWDEEGNKIEESYYVKGLPHGLSTHWYANGQKKDNNHYLNGTKISEKSWYPNGAIQSRALVEDGQFTVFSRWYETGEKEVEFDVSGQKSISWYKNTAKKSESHYKATRLHGLYTTWDKEGNKIEELTFSNGIEHGKITAWYGNGQKRFQAKYQGGKLNGLLEQWYKDGKRKEHSYCRRGLKKAERTWYPKAKKSVFQVASGEAINGLKMSQGEFTEFLRWYETGEKEYSYDVSNKMLTRWFKNGTIQSVLHNKGTEMHDLFAKCNDSIKREEVIIYSDNQYSTLY